jgi:hypothetical protein
MKLHADLHLRDRSEGKDDVISDIIDMGARRK